ncbi:MAG: phosphate-starvation-inducible PsiE family protein, partial [Nitrospirales bacterium]
NDLLLVIILLELFRTVVRFLQTDIITLEPFLNIGIIASIRRILTAGAELAHLHDISDPVFMRYLMDIGLNVAVVLVLMLAVFMVRKSPPDTPAPDISIERP